jgi:hypothetical protein
MYLLLPRLFASLEGSAVKDLLLLLTVAFGVALIDRAVSKRESLEDTESVVRKVLQEQNEALQGAAQAHISGIFPNRKEALPEIRERLRHAKKRVWLLGVSFAEYLSLDSDLREILEEIAPPPGSADPAKVEDVRLMLLDPYRSPAVFRCMLEGSTTEMASVVAMARSGDAPGALLTLFDQLLYRRFESTLALLATHPYLQLRTKFYAHNPSFWAVAIDDFVYFEPYTFGGAHGPNASCIGPLMPVLRFERRENDSVDSSLQNPFDVVLDHFKKLWVTSDTDVFHMRKRHMDRNAIVTAMLNTRLTWLERVQWELHELATDPPEGTRRPAGRPKRRDPRQDCTANISGIEAHWSRGRERTEKASIRDTSAHGIGLRIYTNEPPQENDAVRLTRGDAGRDQGADYQLRVLSSQCHGEFVVKWTKPNGSGFDVGLCTARESLRH